jgi:zinc protease
MISFQNIKNIIVNRIFNIKLLLTLLAVTLCFSANLMSADYETFELKNGLKVHMLKTNSPIVTHAVVYNVGSRQETSGKEGVAHYLEHVMFLGTNKYSKKDFSTMVKETGAYYNAFTSYDLTFYYLNLPSRHLKKAIQIEADRMKWLLFDDKLVENEKQVINQENKMYKNNVYSVFYDSLRSYIFPTTNYGRTIIGWEDEFNKLTKKDLQDFYNTWYAPNNAQVFIIGDIDFIEVKKLAIRYYGRLSPSRKINYKTKLIEEPYNSSVRVNFKDERIKQDIIVKSFLVPSLSSDASVDKKEAYSLIMLENLLSSSFGKVYKYLVLDKKVLLDFSVNYGVDQQGSTTFSFTLLPASGISYEEAESEFNFILNKTLDAGFSPLELRENRRLIKDRLELLREDDMEYLFMVARYMNSGLSYQEIQKLVNNVSIVKTVDVKNVYNKYIKDSYSVVGISQRK